MIRSASFARRLANPLRGGLFGYRLVPGYQTSGANPARYSTPTGTYGSFVRNLAFCSGSPYGLGWHFPVASTTGGAGLQMDVASSEAINAWSSLVISIWYISNDSTGAMRQMVGRDDEGNGDSQFSVRWNNGSTRWEFVIYDGTGSYLNEKIAYATAASGAPNPTTYLNKPIHILATLTSFGVGGTARISVNGWVTSSSAAMVTGLYKPTGTPLRWGCSEGETAGSTNGIRTARGWILDGFVAQGQRVFGPSQNTPASMGLLYHNLDFLAPHYASVQRAYPIADLVRGGGKRGG